MTNEVDADQALTRRIRAGDHHALVEFFGTHRERLRRMVQLRMDRRLQGRIDPSDVIQEAFVDAAMSAFNAHDSFRGRNILKPLYSDLAAFEILSQAMMEMGRGLIQHATASIRPFAKQLYVNKDACNENTARLLPTYTSPDMMLLIRKMCDFLVENKWSRKYEPAQRSSAGR